MDVIEIIFGIIILVISFFVGIWISENTKEELKRGKKWFLAIVFISLFLGVFFILLDNFVNVIICFSLFIIALVGFWGGKFKN